MIGLLVLGLVIAAMLAGQGNAPPDSPPARGVQTYGALRTVMHDSRLGAVVQLDTLLPDPQLYAVGALADLAGEITIVGGEAYLAYPVTADSSRTVIRRGEPAAACLLVAGTVAEWISVTTAQEIDWSEIDREIPGLAGPAGIDVAVPFPFLIEGRVRDLEWHVIDGSRLPDGGGSHLAHREAAVRHRLATGQATLLGFHSAQHHGVFTHMGSNTHIHCVTRDPLRSGHVDHVVVPAGTAIHFPRQ
jgi:acetolactate decarboxylase